MEGGHQRHVPLVLPRPHGQRQVVGDGARRSHGDGDGVTMLNKTTATRLKDLENETGDLQKKHMNLEAEMKRLHEEILETVRQHVEALDERVTRVVGQLNNLEGRIRG